MTNRLIKLRGKPPKSVLSGSVLDCFAAERLEDQIWQIDTIGPGKLPQHLKRRVRDGIPGRIAFRILKALVILPVDPSGMSERLLRQAGTTAVTAEGLRESAGQGTVNLGRSHSITIAVHVR